MAWKPVQHVAGVGQARRPAEDPCRSARPVGDRRLRLLCATRTLALGASKTLTALAAAVLDHRQGPAGVCVDDDGHIANGACSMEVSSTTAPGTGGCGDAPRRQPRPWPLTSAFTDGRSHRRGAPQTDRHHLRVRDRRTLRRRRPRRRRPSNSGCSSSHRLSQPPHTETAAASSHQRGAPPRHLADQAHRALQHPVALEPARARATRLTDYDPHPQLLGACPQPPTSTRLEVQPHRTETHRHALLVDDVNHRFSAAPPPSARDVNRPRSPPRAGSRSSCKRTRPEAD